jgi:molybdopterin synthase sulfur carrier subunit
VTCAVRVVLPAHLRALARIDGELSLEVAEPVTPRHIVDAIEARFPMLRGTIRDYTTGSRRAFVRFFACEQDLSHDSPDDAVPAEVANGSEPFLVIGAMAGG